jgi:hypothetical protein
VQSLQAANAAPLEMNAIKNVATFSPIVFSRSLIVRIKDQKVALKSIASLGRYFYLCRSFANDCAKDRQVWAGACRPWKGAVVAVSSFKISFAACAASEAPPFMKPWSSREQCSPAKKMLSGCTFSWAANDVYSRLPVPMGRAEIQAFPNPQNGGFRGQKATRQENPNGSFRS